MGDSMTASELNRGIIFRPSQTVRASTSVDGLVLLDLRGGLVLTANEVGARIWALIERRLDGGGIAQQLSSDYDVPVERAERDVAAFLTALAARGLVSEELAAT